MMRPRANAVRSATWTPVDLTRNCRKHTKAPYKVKLHEKDYAVFWHDGVPKVANDTCWHRAASLSAGGQVLENGCVKCKYHGLTSKPSSSDALVERDGIIWMKAGDGELPVQEMLPPTSWELETPGLRVFDYARRFSGCSSLLTVENTLDFSHLDSVHAFHLIDGRPEVEINRTGYNGMASYTYSSKVLGKLVIENEYLGCWSSCLRFILNGAHAFTIHFCVVPHTPSDSTLLVRVSRSENKLPIMDALYLAVNELPLWEDRYVVRHADPTQWSKNKLTKDDAFLKEYRNYVTEFHPDVVSAYLS